MSAVLKGQSFWLQKNGGQPTDGKEQLLKEKGGDCEGILTIEGDVSLIVADC
jgi:hypothetical protein